MKRILTLLLVLLTFNCGCNDEEKTDTAKMKGSMNRSIIHTLRQMSIDKAVISEHTLYPHHFEYQQAQLNELGKKNLRVMSEYLQNSSGIVNISSQNTDQQLYSQRLQHVKDFLQNADIQTSRIKIDDGFPAGPGMPTTKLIKILTEESEKQAAISIEKSAYIERGR